MAAGSNASGVSNVRTKEERPGPGPRGAGAEGLDKRAARLVAGLQGVLLAPAGIDPIRLAKANLFRLQLADIPVRLAAADDTHRAALEGQLVAYLGQVEAFLESLRWAGQSSADRHGVASF